MPVFLRTLNYNAPFANFQRYNLNVARNYTRAPKAESIQMPKRCKQKNNHISTAFTEGTQTFPSPQRGSDSREPRRMNRHILKMTAQTQKIQERLHILYPIE